MRNMSEKISIIIPCYNESERLDVEAFKRFEDQLHFLFVNDGSSDNTAEIIKRELGGKNCDILDLRLNCGKGEAIRRGYLYLKTLPVYEELSWVGYWDADLATPLSELNYFFSPENPPSPPFPKGGKGGFSLFFVSPCDMNVSYYSYYYIY